jgi:hypothetical protein
MIAMCKDGQVGPGGVNTRTLLFDLFAGDPETVREGERIPLAGEYRSRRQREFPRGAREELSPPCLVKTPSTYKNSKICLKTCCLPVIFPVDLTS